ncbi:MAG: SDR family oxidoreductase [Ignavibacteria bacterium]|nr:SDR family oxidoreductase [Ignavibacteria bacterium]
MAKKILITGSNGLVGQKLAFVFSQSEQYQLLLTSKHEKSVFGNLLPYRKMNLSVKKEVHSVVNDYLPDVIINAGSYTDVDGCEKEKEQAWLANVVGVEHLISAVKSETHIIHYSSDYIFDGKAGPYDETSLPNPISYYGKTKLASENALRMSSHPFTILRTLIVYGTGINVKTNFALWVIRSLQEKKNIRVVTDQWGNPTLADDLAFAALKIVELERAGVYNIAGENILNRFQFAQTIAEQFQLNTSHIIPIVTSDLKQVAPRPLRSGFITLKAETELSLKLSGVTKGLSVLYHQLMLEKKQN